MISANISNEKRKKIYARDGYRCALCDCTRTIQVHHLIPRGQGGTNCEQNLITLCAYCHSHIHGRPLYETDITREDIEQMATEYLADYYAPDWDPWKRDGE